MRNTEFFLDGYSFSIIAPSDTPWASSKKCPTMPAVGVAQRKVHLGKASEQTGSIPVAGAKVQRSLIFALIYSMTIFSHPSAKTGGFRRTSGRAGVRVRIPCPPQGIGIILIVCRVQRHRFLFFYKGQICED